MELHEALKIVLELAAGNVLTKEQTNNDETLIAEQEKQQSAVNHVRHWMNTSGDQVMEFSLLDLEKIKRVFKVNDGINNRTGHLDYFDGIIKGTSDEGKVLAVAGVRLNERGYLKEITVKEGTIRSTGGNYYPLFTKKTSRTFDEVLSKANYFYEKEMRHGESDLPTKERLTWSLMT